jgi:hypothetical protein
MAPAHPTVISAEHHVGFFQRKSVQVLLPFATSLLLHAGLIVIGLMLFQAVTVITVVKTETQTGLADFSLENSIQTVGKITGLPGVGTDESLERTQNIEMDDVDPASLKFTAGNAEKAMQQAGASGGDTDAASMFGPGPGRPGSFGPGFGPGSGAEGPKGKWGRFGPPSDGGPGSVFQPPQARKIVFVCDATGSMTPVFSNLRRQLADFIDRLDEKDLQFFNVIFFSDDKVLSLSPQLIKADPANKRKASGFFNDTTPRGLTNPLPAIRQAFAQNPEVIYVLTDGFDQVNDLESVVREFDTLNKNRMVRVHTILVGSGEQKELVEVLKRIAELNNGTFKNVSREDF